MIKKCLVCGKHFDTTKIGRYKYCSEKCAKSKNKNNYLRDISILRFNEPMQVDLEGDGYADGELVYDYGKCPKCGWNFEEGDKDWEQPYCCHCGQKLKWFDNEAESEEYSMRKVIMYCDRCKKEFEKWNHKKTEVYGIAEFVYDDSDPYLDEPKDLCESCYIELENWWNFTPQTESEE